METYQAIYENGVFRPVEPVALPEQTRVTVIPQPDEAPPLGCNSPELYEILGRSYDTGETDLAARVDEHQP